MKVSEKYVVYELNSVLGSPQHHALGEVEFRGMVLIPKKKQYKL